MVDDAGVVEASRSLSFKQEALTEFFFLFRRLAMQRDGLDRDQAIDLRVAGLVDHAHGSAAEFGNDLVAAKTPDWRAPVDTSTVLPAGACRHTSDFVRDSSS